MNPFMLLIKPMMAAGLLVTKMVVAGGYVATEDRPAPPPPTQMQAQAIIVRVAVSPEDGRLNQMELELPNGELFELSGLEENTDAKAVSFAPRRRPGRNVFGSASAGRAPVVVAMLQSTHGRSMRCDVSFESNTESGSARCKADGGETYNTIF